MTPEPVVRRIKAFPFVPVLIGVVLYILLSLLLAKIWPWGSDFLYFNYPVAEKWLAGYRDIYDPNVSILFYPPWSLFVIVPLGFFPIQWAHGFQLAASLIFILLSVRLFQGSKPFPKYFYILALLNLHSFDLYIRGQLDAIVLLGIALGYWAIQKRKPAWLSLAFCLMVMKPPLNVLLVLGLYAIAIRRWSARELFTAFLAPVLMVILSSTLVGWNWPLRWLENRVPIIDYLSISIWNIAERLNIPKWIIAVAASYLIYVFVRKSWKWGVTLGTLSLALATTFMLTVYANGDHYVLLIPALLFALQKSKRLGWLAYAVTFTPLLRLAWGPSASSIDILYPLILLIGAYYWAYSEPSQSLDLS